MQRTDGIEHRWSSRKPVVMEVTVYHKGLAVGQCKTRNVGREGVFLETNSLALPLHTVLDVALPQDVVGKHHKQRIPGLVIHNHDGGLGIMFCSFDHNLFVAMDRLLAAVPSRYMPEERAYGGIAGS